MVRNPSARKRIAALALVGATAASGCYSISTAQTPQPVAPGHVRGSVGVMGGAASNEAKYGQELGLRVGVFPRVDVGLKTSLAAVEGDFKVLIVDASEAKIALVPGVIVAEDMDLDPVYDEDDSADEEDGWPILAGRGSVLVGVPAERDLEILFGPDVHVGHWSGDKLAQSSVSDRQLGPPRPSSASDPSPPTTVQRPGASAHYVGVGAHVGIYLRAIGGGVICEVGVLHLVHGLSAGQDAAHEDPYFFGPSPSFEEFAAGGTRIQFTLSFLIGARDAPLQAGP